LSAASGHLTAEQVAARVDGEVNLATVYRALSVLQEVGLVHSVRLGDHGSLSWELTHPDDHAHLVCRVCGDVDHHVGNAVEQLKDHLLSGHGFEATGVELVVTGVCVSCGADADGAPVPGAGATK